jgi:hypothetical protein
VATWFAQVSWCMQQQRIHILGSDARPGLLRSNYQNGTSH